VSAATSRDATGTPAPSGAGGGVPDLLLDAVGELLADRTWAAVRMADVAERAGLSRQTVYNSFGTREGLAQAYVTREAASFLAAVERLIAANAADPVRALSAALEMFLAAAETHPLVRAISASDDGDELLALVTTRGGPVLGPLTARLTDVICATWPPAEAADARLAADALVRLAISHAALPTAPPAATAADVARILAPFIEQRLGARGA
jgi:AcrR family transcriptional regulator